MTTFIIKTSRVPKTCTVLYVLFCVIQVVVLSIKSKFKQSVSHGEADIVNRWPSHSIRGAVRVSSVKFPSANLFLQSSMAFMGNIPCFGLIIYL